jgi:endogenous inhibitor of DNA gyrase (YacG/DUF329 family)
MYDTVMIPCPKCGTKYPAQTKSGECILAEYDLKDAPSATLGDINRHAPFECQHCRTKFEVELTIQAVPKLMEDEQ